MSEHIVTGTTEEERKKEIYDYTIKHGWDEGQAQVYAVVLGDDWLPELEPNYIEFFNHKPLSDIYVGEITLKIPTLCIYADCAMKYCKKGSERVSTHAGGNEYVRAYCDRNNSRRTKKRTI